MEPPNRPHFSGSENGHERRRGGGNQTDDRIWLVSFMDCDLGYFDDETCRLERLAHPFGPKVLPQSSD